MIAVLTHGEKPQTIETVRQIELVTPRGAGRVWQGIPHGELCDTISDEVRSRGWKVTDAQFHVSKDQADMAAAFALSIPDIDAPEGQTFSLGLLTSNAMRRTLKIVVGTNVRVCNNGMATGEVVLRAKHTTGFDLIGNVEHAITAYEEKIRAIPALVAKMRETELPPDSAEHILMEAGRAGMMPWSRIGKVDEEYRHPTFAEHGKGTAWALMQAFTYIVKDNPPQFQMDQMNAFRRLLPIAV